jgi:phosphatidate cytidylyltransferase
MLKRVITAIVAVIIFLPILWLSNTYVFPTAIAIITCVSLFEMFSCLGFQKQILVTLPSYIIGAALPYLGKLAGGIDPILFPVCAIMFIYILYLMILAVFKHDKYSLNDLAMCYMTSLYIIGGFSSVQFLRDMNTENNIYLLVFIGAWITDIFAYFTGMLLGKHKLCEAISPKKTIEGSIGGVVFCALAFILFAVFALDTEITLWKCAILAGAGIIISIVSQIGDLSMSLIKRHYGIKDFGKIFPGHGGMLDRFDSIIAVALTLFILISALNAYDIELFVWSGR